MSYAQAQHKQVEEVFLVPNSRDPVGHSLEPGDWVFQNHYQRKTVLKTYWKGLALDH